MEFLSNTQNSDGSLNDTYPYIWSVAAVAFPTYTISEAYMMLYDDMNASSRELIADTLEKAGNWLLKSHDTQVSNQESAALISLYNLYLITKDEKYAKGAESKLRLILEKRSDEGWFFEYGGGDISYLTITLDSIAKYYKKTRCSDLLPYLDKAVEFASYFVHPNGTIGGEYTSRTPEFVIPSGLETISKEIPLAASIADSNIHALEKGNLINPLSLDDTFLCFLLHTYFEAYDNYQPRVVKSIDLPYARSPFTKYFSDSGYVVIKMDQYYMIIGASKGGVIRIYGLNSESELILSDCGFLGKLKNGQMISSQWFNLSNKTILKEGYIGVSGQFYKVDETLFNTPKMILSRIGLYTMSRVSPLREFIYQSLRKLMITGSKALPIDFTREIHYDSYNISIDDELKFKGKFEIDYFNIEDKYSTIYGQSKEFFQKQELFNIRALPEDNLAPFIKDRCILNINRVLSLKNNDLRYKIMVDSRQVAGDME